jgi:hypothetical protein
LDYKTWNARIRLQFAWCLDATNNLDGSSFAGA